MINSAFKQRFSKAKSPFSLLLQYAVPLLDNLMKLLADDIVHCFIKRNFSKLISR